MALKIEKSGVNGVEWENMRRLTRKIAAFNRKNGGINSVEPEK